MKNELNKIIEWNQSIIKDAKAWNMRAGKDEFKILTHAELVEFFISKTNANSISSITNFEALKLPTLDQGVIDSILKLNPEKVTIDGYELEVDYKTDYYNPLASIKVPQELVETTDCINIFDHRKISLSCDGYKAETFPILLEQINNGKILDAISQYHRDNNIDSSFYVDDIPNNIHRINEKIELLKIDEQSIYGYWNIIAVYDNFKLVIEQELKSEENQKNLTSLLNKCKPNLMFQIIDQKPYKIKESYYWELTELGHKLENNLNKQFIERLKDVKPENIEEKINTQQSLYLHIKKQQEKLNSIDLYTELDIHVKAFVQDNIKNIESWITKAHEMICFLDLDLEDIYKEINIEQENIKTNLISFEQEKDNGEILIDFEAWHRRGGASNNGDGWVIKANGELKENNDSSIGRYKSDGRLKWNVVNKDELALVWSCDSIQNIPGTSTFEVKKRPKNLTKAQLDKVRDIEINDIKTLENSFQLDEDKTREQKGFGYNIIEDLEYCPVCGDEIDYPEDLYFKVCNNYGFNFCSSYEVEDFIDYNKDFDDETEGREAQIISKRFINNGVLEILAYAKYGTWNLNMRFREATKGECEEIVQKEKCTNNSNNTFQHTNKRYFKCTCGCQERISKSDMTKYTDGESIAIKCSLCGIEDNIIKKL